MQRKLRPKFFLVRFKGLVFVDGKLMSEAYGCSKKTAKMKSCLKALQTVSKEAISYIFTIIGVHLS